MRRRRSKALLLIALPLGILLGLIALALIAIQVPSIWFREPLLKRVLPLVARHGLKISWQGVRLSASSQSFLAKSFSFDFDELCVRQKAEVSVCFHHARLAAKVDFSSFKPRIREIGPVSLMGGQVVVRASPSHETDQKKSRENALDTAVDLLSSQEIPLIIRSALVRDFEADVPDVKVLGPGVTVEGSAKIAAPYAPHGRAWNIDAQATLRSGSESPRKLAARVRVTGPDATLRGPWALVVNGSAALPPSEQANAHLSISPKEEGKFHFELAGKAKLPGSKHHRTGPLRATLQGDFARQELHAILNADWKHPEADFQWVKTRHCAVSLDRVVPAPERLAGHLSLDCPVSLNPSDRLFTRVRREDFPPSFDLRIGADLRSAFPPRFDLPVNGNLSVDMKSWQTPLLASAGRVSAEIEGVPNQFPREWGIHGDLGVGIKIREFGKIVDRLRPSPYAVPAPLNVLRGEIEAGLRGTIKLVGLGPGGSVKEARIPLYLQTRLHSAQQDFVIHGNATWTARGRDLVRGGALKGQLSLEEVRIVLPRVATTQVGNVPRLVPDPRIQTSLAAPRRKPKPKAPEQPTPPYDIRVTTPPNHPVELVSNLAKRPIPVFLDLHAISDGKSSTTEGTVRIGGFPLKLFRRDAVLESLTLRLPKPNQAPKVDGSVRVSYADYTIRIEIHGTTKEPQLRLTSEPPLPEDQLVAVLFFGEPLDELDPTQSEATGSLAAAIGDRALGLFSLWFLASTPIQSVGYDPQTKQFTAKLKLGTGTSLNIGSHAGESLSELGIRKRIGQHWVFSTGLEYLDTIGERIFSAFLEWHNRY